MNDLILYGNVYDDKIINIHYGKNNILHKINTSLGGIFNLSDCIKLTNLNLKYEHQPINCFNSIIIVDENNVRTSIIVKDESITKLFESTFKIKESKWHHIAYLNFLPTLKLEDVKKMKESGIVSVDLCNAGFNYDKNILDLVDMIIISKNEELLIPNHHMKKTIIHDKKGTIWFGEFFKNNHIIDIKCDVGSGDAFAASFISEYLKTKSLTDSIEFAHKNTSLYLKLRYESI